MRDACRLWTGEITNAAAEANGDPVQGAGLPSFINDRSAYVTFSHDFLVCLL
jgi:hypothetical protein